MMPPFNSSPKLCIGFTGGIGSGKSTVAAMFAEHGAKIIDTDIIAHYLTQPGGKAIHAIFTAFGEPYITENGALNRAKIRALIFSDASAKQRLEHILHPLIREEAGMQLQNLENSPYTILVVPLLPESPAFLKIVQRVLVVDCDEKTQIARVMGRNHMTEKEVRAIIDTQTPRAKRLQLADDILYNDAGIDDLKEQVSVLHERYSSIKNNDAMDRASQNP